MPEDKTTENEIHEEIRADVKNSENKQSDEYLNRLKYLQAEFENYKKYIEKTQKQMQETASEALVKDMLPVLDDFEATLKNIKNVETKEGIQMVFNNLLKALEKHGLREIPVGECLDPYYHEAVLQGESESGEGAILEILQKGYMLNSKVIRHTKVKVSR